MSRVMVCTLIVLISSGAAMAAAQTASRSDSTLRAVQQRGGEVMGVDQTSSSHFFDLIPTGARIVLQRDSVDSRGTATIRAHLRKLASSFAAGDFSMPEATHAATVPGTAVMALRRKAISFRVHYLPRGTEVVMTTRDTAALTAIGEFVRFQRMDHRSGGADSTNLHLHRMQHPKP